MGVPFALVRPDAGLQEKVKPVIIGRFHTRTNFPGVVKATSTSDVGKWLVFVERLARDLLNIFKVIHRHFRYRNGDFHTILLMKMDFTLGKPDKLSYNSEGSSSIGPLSCFQRVWFYDEFVNNFLTHVQTENQKGKERKSKRHLLGFDRLSRF